MVTAHHSNLIPYLVLRVKRPAFKSWVFHLINTQSWKSQLNYLSLCILIYKMRIMMTMVMLLLFTPKGIVKNIFVKALCKLSKDLVLTLHDIHVPIKFSYSVFFMTLWMQLFLLPGMPSPPHTHAHMSQSFKSQLKCHLLSKAFPNSPFPGKLDVTPPSFGLPQYPMCPSLLIYHFLFCSYSKNKPSVHVFSPLLEEEPMLYSFLLSTTVNAQ